MSVPISFDPKGVLIDKLGENSERFATSNLYFKNGRGLTALFEIEKLKSEFYDIARDPNINDDELGIPVPKQPDLTGLTEQQQNEKTEIYRKLMREYNLAITATRMQVPVADMFAIEQYMEPFYTTIHATPAVKGRRFHAFTKNVEEPNNGLFGLKKGGGPSG